MSAQDIDTTTGTRTGQDLAAEHLATMARTADLVRKLTALADRYDAMHDDDGRAAARACLTVRLRAAADAGRLLLRTSAPPVTPEAGVPVVSVQERADRAASRDVQAAGRDAAAESRDVQARHRDERLRGLDDDADACFPGRFLAACGRDDAAGDRAEAFADRRAAAADRAAAARPTGLGVNAQAAGYALITRLEGRSFVREAQGVLMTRDGLSAGEAFETLMLSAALSSCSLEAAADQVLRHAQVPVRDDEI